MKTMQILVLFLDMTYTYIPKGALCDARKLSKTNAINKIFVKEDRGWREVKVHG